MTYKKNSKELIDDMMVTNGYLYCQECNRVNVPLDPPHHIIFRSEKPNHPELHNKKNLIIVCRGCHMEFHGHNGYDKIKRRQHLVDERNLNELFNG